MNLFYRDCGFLSVTDHNGCFRSKLHKTFQCVCCFSLGAGLQHFSHSDQSEDHCRRLKIKVHHVIFHSSHVPADLSACHGKKHIHAPDKGRHGAKGNKRVHIVGSVPETFESADKKLLVNDHDDPCKKQL